MHSNLRVLLGVMFVTGVGLAGCVAKDGVVGEIDGVGQAGAGAEAKSAAGSARFWVDELRSPVDPDLCMPYQLPVVDGDVACRMYGVQVGSGECCRGPLRTVAGASAAAAVADRMRINGHCDAEGQPSCASFCVCEIAKAVGDDLEACLDPYAQQGNGWCYIAPAQGLGAAAAVASCEAGPPAKVNLAGQASAEDGELAFIACNDSSLLPTPSPLGSVCVADLEKEPDFHGFRLDEVTVSEQPSCESGLCLVAHFLGRVSCPYGQRPDDLSQCFLPGSDANVSVEVAAQLLARPPSLASTCSCRCAGPGPGPFCECAADQECVDLIPDLGLPNSERLVGSYCALRGSLDGWHDHSNGDLPCFPDLASCGPARPY
jgi:hypothetical protein